jgi:hypothetical protein
MENGPVKERACTEILLQITKIKKNKRRNLLIDAAQSDSIMHLRFFQRFPGNKRLGTLRQSPPQQQLEHQRTMDQNKGRGSIIYRVLS